MYFIPKAYQIYVGSVWSDPNNRHDKHEEDHDLYFDAEMLEFFVVEKEDFVSGPNVSVEHTIKDAKAYLTEYPDRRGLISGLIVQRLRGSHGIAEQSAAADRPRE